MILLDPPHLLEGQFGLFAARPFSQFDIVGEHCGEVVPATNNNQQKHLFREVLKQLPTHPGNEHASLMSIRAMASHWSTSITSIALFCTDLILKMDSMASER
jgi:hypothetical protein